MPTHLIFDIETRQDTDLMDATGYRAKEGTFAPVLYHLPVAVAVGHMTPEGVLARVESLGEGLLASDPALLTDAFWALANHAAVLVTFNGRNFDIPVLELCALRYGVPCVKHWSEQYGSRYRYGKAHLDMLDILSNYGGATKGLTLANVCQLLGYQGKDGMDGSKVQAMWDAGQIEDIREYNRLDVIRTYAVWLQYARIAGRLTEPLYQTALVASKSWLDQIR